jgi:hypothetical protein
VERITDSELRIDTLARLPRRRLIAFDGHGKFKLRPLLTHCGQSVDNGFDLGGGDGAGDGGGVGD